MLQPGREERCCDPAEKEHCCPPASDLCGCRGARETSRAKPSASQALSASAFAPGRVARLGGRTRCISSTRRPSIAIGRKAQWSPWDVDLSADREQWTAIEDRSLVSFLLGSLMVAEERITTEVLRARGRRWERGGSHVPRHTAGGRGAPHAVLCALSGRGRRRAVRHRPPRERARSSSHLRSGRSSTRNWSPRTIDCSPTRRPCAKVTFVTLYHLILEATLGLTTFEFATRYLEREGLLPGFLAGYSKIHHDEHRHIAYGTWYLREAWRGSSDRRCRAPDPSRPPSRGRRVTDASGWHRRVGARRFNGGPRASPWRGSHAGSR